MKKYFPFILYYLAIAIFITATGNIFSENEKYTILLVLTFWGLALIIKTKNGNSVVRFLLISLKIILIFLTISGFASIQIDMENSHSKQANIIVIFIILISIMFKYRHQINDFALGYRTKTKEVIRSQNHISEKKDLYSLDPYEYEEAVAEYLRDKGYFEVDTTPKSGDFGADVIATSPNGKRICVQCKRYNADNKVGVKAVQEIFSAKEYYNCEKAYIFTTSSFTEQAKAMAKKLDVILLEYR